MKDDPIIQYKSPIGLLQIRGSEKGIISLKFVDEEPIDYKENPNSILTQCATELDEYFSGTRKTFSVPLAYTGTAFQRKVWIELLKIPFGATRSYKEIAFQIGNEKASRAVGLANNKNPIAIIVPCHRIIGTNKKLIGYAGGLWRKEWLLKHEKIHTDSISTLDSFLKS